MKKKLLLVLTYILISSVAFAQSATPPEAPKAAQTTGGFAGDNDDKKIEVYPNPSTGIVNLTLTGFKGKKTELRVMNVIGNIVHREVLNGDETSRKVLDLTKEASGLYYIKLQTDDYSEIRKIIIN